MRIGRVKMVLFSYVVDLDEEDQVELAKEYIVGDLRDLLRYSEIDNCLELEEDPELTRSDISPAILEILGDIEEVEDDE
jgi:hypothetical protein